MPIIFVKDLQAIQKIDEHTLVYLNLENRSIDRKAPVFDILANASPPAKWPAAILGTVILKSKQEALVRKNGYKMLANPRVVKMLEGYEVCSFDHVQIPAAYYQRLGSENWWERISTLRKRRSSH
jgi:hypothetical protein